MSFENDNINNFSIFYMNLVPLNEIKSCASVQSFANSPYLIAYITFESFLFRNSKLLNHSSLPILFVNDTVYEESNNNESTMSSIYCSYHMFHFLSKNLEHLIKSFGNSNLFSNQYHGQSNLNINQIIKNSRIIIEQVKPIILDKNQWSLSISKIRIVWDEALELLYPHNISKRFCAPYLSHEFTDDNLIKMHLLDRYIPSVFETDGITLYLPIKLLNKVILLKVLVNELSGFVDENTKVEWIFDSKDQFTNNIILNEEDIFLTVGGYRKLHDSLKSKLDSVLLNQKPMTLSFILHGPEGTGKTLYGKALTNLYKNKYHIPTHYIEASKIWKKTMKEIENKDIGMQYEFTYLESITKRVISQAPSLIVLDDFEIISASETSQSTIDQIHILSSLRNMLDSFQSSQKPIIFIAITRNIELIDSSLRISNRLSFEKYISIPNEEERKEILKIHFTQNEQIKTCGGEFIYNNHKNIMSDLTPGFVGRDIERMAFMSIYHAFSRVNQTEKRINDLIDKTNLNPNLLKKNDYHDLIIPKLSFEDVLYALESVPPSQIADVASSSSKIPKVKLSEIYGYQREKKRCRDAIFGFLEHHDTYEKLGIKGCSGILLYGPSGCGKTLLSQALANEGKMNFFSVKCPELFSKYYGETESTIRALFRRARQLEPCVLLFDEIDAIAQNRSDGLDSQSDGGSSRKALVQLLTEMDGIQSKGQLIVIGCTNRRDEIDEAILRPGRMDLQIEISLPSYEDRIQILKNQSQVVDSSVDFSNLANRTDRMSGADLSALCREASLLAIKRYHTQQSGIDPDSLNVTMEDFNKALSAMNRNFFF